MCLNILENIVSPDDEKDFQTSLIRMNGIIFRTFGEIISKSTYPKLYELMVRPKIKHVTETWTWNETDRRRLGTAEKNFKNLS
jgi:hypothetical protein